MARLRINPQFGNLEDAKKIDFELIGLSNKTGLRLKIENASDSVFAQIEGIHR